MKKLKTNLGSLVGSYILLAVTVLSFTGFTCYMSQAIQEEKKIERLAKKTVAFYGDLNKDGRISRQEQYELFVDVAKFNGGTMVQDGNDFRYLDANGNRINKYTTLKKWLINYNLWKSGQCKKGHCLK